MTGRIRTHYAARIAAVALVCASGLMVSAGPSVAAGPCDPPVPNKIACENSLPGTPQSAWDVTGAGDATIQGFATAMSVNLGSTIDFKVKTTAADYQLDIYRIGYYAGDGARKIATIAPTAALPQSQPACATDASTGLVDCGNWAVSASWDVPAAATSGVYIARLARTDTGGASHIMFVVRDDASSSDLLVQTSDTTWQAYNDYGGNSLYVGSPAGRAYKVSYNRPLVLRGNQFKRASFFANEYPLVRWLEANGYDASYLSGVDTDRSAALLRTHKVFVSSGHDEYWSATQRANVEAARDAGVHLAFFSGNEVFWKTRWESSIDGSSTPRRTLVTYKETKAGAKIDPDPAWTGTWRDPRFSPPSDGGRPENGLTGTIFTVNCCRADAMNVPAEEGNLRLWRGTSVAGQSAGTITTLTPGTVGYEFDEDLDNGARPAGLFRQSKTTLSVAQKLIDYGNTYAAGTATHSVTSYRAPSGALVFGAGTIRWSWGLDGQHDDGSSTPDQRMRQATVNLLADMNAQPATLQQGLIAASASTDTSSPTSTITSPAGGTSVVNGTVITVSGTASDAGGGRVGGVEVSTDGGSTWHPANGRENWTYQWPPNGRGPVTVKTRAVDDSGNLESPGGGTAYNITCPCKLFGDGVTPTGLPATDSAAVEVGMRFRPDIDGFITGARFFKGASNTGTHTGSLWTSTGTRLATATFAGESASGWQDVTFDNPVGVSAGVTYVVSYHAPNGHYSSDRDWFATKNTVNAPLVGLRSATGALNGLFLYGSGGFPTSGYKASNYWVDVVFSESAADNTPPSVTGRTPAPGSTSAPTTAAPTATFDEPIAAGSVAFTMTSPAGPVSGAVAYDPGTRTVTFTPAVALAPATVFTASVSASDVAGNAMAAPVTWTFTTAASPPPLSCPCSVWDNTVVPAVPSATDTAGVELGMRFRASTSGSVTAVRFYKGSANAGTHVGRLWTNAGSLLASVTFTGESASGWQEMAFDSPVAITAGTTYVVSYTAPVGRYAATKQYFATSRVNGPLTALASGVDGLNGVFRYGTTGQFPNSGYQSSNYWVDLVFGTGDPPPPDTVAPQVTSTSPASGATNVLTGSTVSAVFNEAVTAATIAMTVTPTGGSAIAGTAAYDSGTRTVTFTPAVALAAATAYTASVSATDTAGNAMAAPVTWTFTTAASGCPCSIWTNSTLPATASTTDVAAVELGVRFRASTAGSVTGVRFYKGAANTGTHVGRLWTNSGALLATVTFTSESASGWQQASFDTPVAITAGTTYVVSYTAPVGRFAMTKNFFAAAGHVNGPLSALKNGVDGLNGIFRYGSTGEFPTSSYQSSNYWVDLVFSDI